MMKPPATTDLKNLNREQLATFLGELGMEGFRAGQVLRWIYQRDVRDFAAMTDLSKRLRT